VVGFWPANTDGDDVADAFVARDEGWVGFDGPVAFDGMQVGVAYAGGGDLDEDLAGSGRWHRNLLDHERLAELANDGGFHSLGHGILLKGWIGGITKPTHGPALAMSKMW